MSDRRSYAEIVNGHRAEEDAIRAMAKRGLGNQAVTAALLAVRAQQAHQTWEAMVAAGQRTPVEAVYSNVDIVDVGDFLRDMAAQKHRRATVFSPAKPDPRAGRKPFSISFGSSTKRGAGNGAVAPANWEPVRGYVIGTTKTEPSPQWTDVEALPRLVVLFEDRTVGTVASQVSSTGRLVPVTDQQPLPLRVDIDGNPEEIVHGSYAPIIRSVLDGAVELPEEVAGLLNRDVSGALFVEAELSDTLAGLSNGGKVPIGSIDVFDTPAQALVPAQRSNGAVANV